MDTNFASRQKRFRQLKRRACAQTKMLACFPTRKKAFRLTKDEQMCVDFLLGTEIGAEFMAVSRLFHVMCCGLGAQRFLYRS